MIKIGVKEPNLNKQKTKDLILHLCRDVKFVAWTRQLSKQSYSLSLSSLYTFCLLAKNPFLLGVLNIISVYHSLFHFLEISF